MQRSCDVCGTTYEAQRSAARYCSGTCAKRAQRGGIARSRSAPHRPPPASLRPVSGLLDAVRAELAAADRTNTVAGQLALELARRIAEAPPMNTGVAALSKQLQATIAQALAGAPAPGRGPVDELKSRRDRKRRAARQ